MKHTLKGQTMRLTTILAAATILAGCSKETKETPPPEETITNPTEVTLYIVDENEALYVSSCLSYLESYPNGTSYPSGEATILCDVDIAVRPLDGASAMVNWTYGDIDIIKKPITLSPITGIDLITNADYDEAHPKGSSLNDIMELHYIGEDGQYYSVMDLTEYFATHPVLNWDSRKSSGWLFRLSAKSLPLKENEIKYTGLAHQKEGEYMTGVDVTLKITMEDGTTLSIAPIPGQKI